MPRYMTIMVMLLFISDLILSVTLAIKSLEKKPIHYLPVSKAGEAYPNAIPQSTVISETLKFLTWLDNFIPQTFPESKEKILHRISPKILTQFEKLLSHREKLIKEAKMAIHLVQIEEDKIETVASSDAMWEIKVRGTRQIYLADEPSAVEKIDYHLLVEKGVSTEHNPHGLYIVAYKEQKW